MQDLGFRRIDEDATAEDRAHIWAILKPVFRAGETYPVEIDIPEEEALDYWLAERAYIAALDGAPVGTFYIKRNQKGGGAHICNCGYITARGAEGKGIARTMLAHSLKEAKRIGFLAMQYNFVLASNNRAVETWKRAGFSEIGRQPQAFLHPTLGYVDALILHKFLD